jgi:hypothetical protein
VEAVALFDGKRAGAVVLALNMAAKVRNGLSLIRTRTA